MRDNVKKWLLATIAVAAFGFAIWQVLRFSQPPRHTQPIPEVDLICTACGHEVQAAIKETPMRCPACRDHAFVLAAYCPHCDVTLPLLDSAFYIAHPMAAVKACPEKVFPRCPTCRRLTMPKFYAKQRK